MEPIVMIESGFIEELCRAYQAPLHRYLTEMVGNPEIAQELAQESFAHVHRTYRPVEVMFPRAMLFRVATNFALMHLRRRRIERRYWGDAINIECVEEGVPDADVLPADRQVLADQIGQHLAAAIKDLRPTLRKVFVMAHLQCKSRKEMAAELGVTEKRVDKRMTKALAACRERMASKGIDFEDVDNPRSLVGLVGKLVADPGWSKISREV